MKKRQFRPPPCQPLPWSVLRYDADQGGYVVNLDKSRLEEAPAYDANKTPVWGDPVYETRIHDYYGANPYWSRTQETDPTGAARTETVRPATREVPVTGATRPETVTVRQAESDMRSRAAGCARR
jgi:hypothetical protein